MASSSSTQFRVENDAENLSDTGIVNGVDFHEASSVEGRGHHRRGAVLKRFLSEPNGSSQRRKDVFAEVETGKSLSSLDLSAATINKLKLTTMQQLPESLKDFADKRGNKMFAMTHSEYHTQIARLQKDKLQLEKDNSEMKELHGIAIKELERKNQLLQDEIKNMKGHLESFKKKYIAERKIKVEILTKNEELKNELQECQQLYDSVKEKIVVLLAENKSNGNVIRALEDENKHLQDEIKKVKHDLETFQQKRDKEKEEEAELLATLENVPSQLEDMMQENQRLEIQVADINEQYNLLLDRKDMEQRKAHREKIHMEDDMSQMKKQNKFRLREATEELVNVKAELINNTRIMWQFHRSLGERTREKQELERDNLILTVSQRYLQARFDAQEQELANNTRIMRHFHQVLDERTRQNNLIIAVSERYLKAQFDAKEEEIQALKEELEEKERQLEELTRNQAPRELSR